MKQWRYAGDEFDCETCGNGCVEFLASDTMPVGWVADGDSARCTQCGAVGCVSADEDDECSVIWAEPKAKGGGDGEA